MPLVALLLVALGFAGLQEKAATPPAAPSIVLVTVDTLRREHLGCYGYRRPTSPRVDELAREAVVFDNAFAPMATTFPSHLTMFTGLYPHQHGYTSNPSAMRRPFRSSAGCGTAAEALRAAGYRTAAFVSSVVLHERTGIGTGFDHFEGPSPEVGKFTARETVDHALAWLAEQTADAPLFLWVHLWDVHEPNEPPAETAVLFRADDEQRAWVRARGIDAAALAQRFHADTATCERFFGWKPPVVEAEPPPGRGRTVAPSARKRRSQAHGDATIDEAAVLALFDRYDACVRAVDGETGRLIDALKSAGRWERASFVFTGDHGQSLGEGAALGHDRNTDLDTHVPLIVRLPSATAQPGRRAELVSLVDLMPTLLARLDEPALAAFRGQCEGQDVLGTAPAREALLTAGSTELHGARAQLEVALVTPRWKYLRHANGPGELFDLAGAGEGVDVRADNAEVATKLASQLEAALARRPARELVDAGATDEATENLLRELEAMGYGGKDD